MPLEDAEANIKKFVAFDRFSMRSVAEVYKPGVPIVDNPEYIQKVKELIPLQSDVMQNKITVDELLRDHPFKSSSPDVKES